MLVYLAGALGTAGVTTFPGFNSNAPQKTMVFSLNEVCFTKHKLFETFDISDACFTALLRKLKPQFNEVNFQRKEHC